MKPSKRLIINTIIATFVAVPSLVYAASEAKIDPNQAIVDSLREELAKVNTPSDSIPLLYDLYDLSTYAERLNNAMALKTTAERAANDRVILDMYQHICNIAATTHNEALIDDLLQEIKTMPESEDKQIAITFMRTCKASAHKFTTEEDRTERIRTLVDQINNEDPEKENLYDRIARMFEVTTYIGDMTQGEMLTEMLDNLEREISKLPFEKSSYLRNKFYTQQAMAYARQEDFEKSLLAERKLMSIMDRLQADYQHQGRKFRNYQIQRYVGYRRMMKGYRAMSEAETEAIYDRVQELATINPDIASDLERRPVVEMAMRLKKKDYEGAIPLIKRLAAQSDNIYDKRYYLRRLKRAAEITGNNELLLEAAVEYNNILEEYVDLKSAERMRELQMSYDFQSLRRDNTEMELSRHRTMAIAAVSVALLLVVLGVVLSVMLTRLARSKRQLTAANAKLQEESDSLRRTTEELKAANEKSQRADAMKSQLVNYVTAEVLAPVNTIMEYSQMIVDNAQGENKDYLDKFKSVVDMNGKLLHGLVADVQELAAMESDRLPVRRQPTDLVEIGRMAEASILPQVAPGVKLSYVHPDLDRLVVNTDQRRVEVVLLNLLSNAAKFTPSGSIELRLSLDEEGHAVFTVTDTGIGIPADKAEDIFRRFEKLNPHIEGSGLGLSVCRMVAKALGAEVTLDTTFPGPGSRFIFRQKK